MLNIWKAATLRYEERWGRCVVKEVSLFAAGLSRTNTVKFRAAVWCQLFLRPSTACFQTDEVWMHCGA